MQGKSLAGEATILREFNPSIFIMLSLAFIGLVTKLPWQKDYNVVSLAEKGLTLITLAVALLLIWQGRCLISQIKK